MDISEKEDISSAEHQHTQMLELFKLCNITNEIIDKYKPEKHTAYIVTGYDRQRDVSYEIKMQYVASNDNNPENYSIKIKATDYKNLVVKTLVTTGVLTESSGFTKLDIKDFNEMSCIGRTERDFVIFNTDFKPLREKVLLQMLPKSYGGLIKVLDPSDYVNPKMDKAIVISVGTGHITYQGVEVKSSVNPGDVVLISQSGGSVIKLDGQTYKIMRDDEILGVFENNNYN